MLAQWLRFAAAALAVLAGLAIAFEMSEEQFADEIQMGWQLGLRARQNSENLQFFTGNVGGANAPAVRTPSLAPPHAVDPTVATMRLAYRQTEDRRLTRNAGRSQNRATPIGPSK